MPATGPTPGSAPMIVPATTPMVTNSRLIGETATEKPRAMCENKSMAAPCRQKEMRPEGRLTPSQVSNST